MPRQMRVEYPGAIYHIMSRDDRPEDIFLNDVDRQDFIKTLAETGHGGAVASGDDIILEAIAVRVRLGSSKGANATLHRWMAQQNPSASVDLPNVGI